MTTDAVDPLLAPLMIGHLQVRNRVFMAPLTRARAGDPDGVPTPMMADYYVQRAGAGLIISEATNISQIARGFAWTPGIYTDDQVQGWRAVTDAVHGAGGRIFCQLWHTGRVSHESLHPPEVPVSASSLVCEQCQAFVRIGNEGGRVPATPPRALTVDDIEATIEDYVYASANAIRAGFDGVEIHAANGYLLHQFIAPNVNDRDDMYGGSAQNRARFLLEVVEAVSAQVGAGRVGVRISPLFAGNGIADPDPGPAFRHVGQTLNGLGIAYLHIADSGTMAPGAASRMDEILTLMGGAYNGPVVLNGAYDADRARRDIQAGDAAAIAFGRSFLANPDLPERLRAGHPLNPPDPGTFYGGAEAGYLDYPRWA
ncbi:MAG: alkene reductase [Actinomycetes bacterium]